MADKKAVATPRPWKLEDDEVRFGTCVIAQVMGAGDFPCNEEEIDGECKANAALIVTAVNSWGDISALRSRIEELERGN